VVQFDISYLLLVTLDGYPQLINGRFSFAASSLVANWCLSMVFRINKKREILIVVMGTK